MGLHSIAKLQKGNQVGKFMDKGEQEGICVQVPVDTDPVIFEVCRMPVVPQYRFRSLVMVRWTWCCCKWSRIIGADPSGINCCKYSSGASFLGIFLLLAQSH